jgi:hypothetical protein
MKKQAFLLILSILLIGQTFCQERDTIIGKIALISNPCFESPCLPGAVFAIENDTSDIILSIDESWQWSDRQLIINNDTLNIDDSIKVIGIISTKKDMQNEIYYEIEVDTTFLMTSSINRIENSNISIYPNPSDGTFSIKSSYSNILGIEVINVNGRRVYFSENDAPVTNVVVEGLKEKGIVILKVLITNNQTITQKILIQ